MRIIKIKNYLEDIIYKLEWIALLLALILCIVFALALSGCVGVKRYERDREAIAAVYDTQEQRIEALESKECKPCEGVIKWPIDPMPIPKFEIVIPEAKP